MGRSREGKKEGGRRIRKEEDKWKKNKEAEDGEQEEEEIHFKSEENEVM